MVKQNVLPLLGVLPSQMRPCIASTSRLLIARPRPLPPNLRWVLLSPCEKEVNSLDIVCGCMPIPEIQHPKKTHTCHHDREQGDLHPTRTRVDGRQRRLQSVQCASAVALPVSDTENSRTTSLIDDKVVMGTDGAWVVSDDATATDSGPLESTLASGANVCVCAAICAEIKRSESRSETPSVTPPLLLDVTDLLTRNT
jgi:hypothetical protein